MTLYEVLTVITCVTSTITMIVVLAGIMPHFKNGLTILRDAVLWVTMVLVLCAIGWIGWQQLISRRSSTSGQGASRGSATQEVAHPIAVNNAPKR